MGQRRKPNLNVFDELPSVDEVLRERQVLEIVLKHGRERVRGWVRKVLEERRDEILRESSLDRRTLIFRSVEGVLAESHRSERSGLAAVINATGVVLHTNLGRAPLADIAVEAASQAARYANLEMDLETGERRTRGYQLAELLQALTGAEAALIVNNCAAATLLTLSVLSAGRETVVSRGQLIEIGGAYRLPEVFRASGAILREVGTTNRTRLSDYKCAIQPETAALLRVHPSNYRIVGFAESVEIGELATLAKRHGVVAIDDVGSGCLFSLADFGLSEEPVVADSIAAGADAVLFSGDKLLGGPQCGVIVGSREIVDRLKSSPLARALRVDKVTLAALEATLEIHRRGREAALAEIPVLQMISNPVFKVRDRAEALRAMLAARSIPSRLVETIATVGGGSAPETPLPSWAAALSAPSSNELARRLRTGKFPIIARVRDDAVLLDMRTVLPGQEPTVVEGICAAFQGAASHAE